MAATKIAFLYSEIAGYFLAGANSLCEYADVLIVRWPTNAEAPFHFQPNKALKIVTKTDFTPAELQTLLHDFNPDVLVCSGWMDKDYLKLVKSVDKRVKRVLTLDNHWTGSAKQRIASWLSPFYLKRYFTHSWVPGNAQAVFAEKLGFKNHILKGFYCADTAFFESKYQASFPKKREQFPKRFLYVARYVAHKGIFEMWEAFRQLQAENPNEWELWCLGTGDQWENRVEEDGIKHFGFVQPADMDSYINQTGVYILPSKFEPWGVSVQEFAVAGFPLLLSSAIGSKEAFLNHNGFSFEPDRVKDIKAAMLKIIRMDDAELIALGERSHAIGLAYKTEDWVKNIMSLTT